jgi:hypothetical protein
MEIRSSKNYRHGFVLTEQELVRLVDTIKEQIRKIHTEQPIEESYEIRFRNGAIAITNSLSEVLAQENLGSSLILRLEGTFTSTGSDEAVSIAWRFENLESSDYENEYSFGYSVRGYERDWVFVTSSQLEERLQRVKRYNLRQHISSTLVLAIVTVSSLGTFSWHMTRDSMTSIDTASSKWDYPVQPPSIEVIDLPPISKEIEAARDSGLIKDAVDAVIYLRKVQEKRDDLSRRAHANWLEDRENWWKDIHSRAEKEEKREIPTLLVLVIPPGVVLVALMGLSIFLRAYYPAFNFCWGDYTEVFKKKESIRRFVAGAILVGILVSFVGGILANLLGS